MTAVASQVGYAGFWRRFAAQVFDAVLVAVVSLSWSLTLDAETVSLLDFVVGFTYEVIGNAWGGTLGIRLLSMRMVTAGGDVPGLVRSLVRSTVSVASLLVFGLGYFWMIWDERKQTWHDKAAGTFVVLT